MIKSFHSSTIYTADVLGILFVMTKVGLTSGTTQNSNSIVFMFSMRGRKVEMTDLFNFFKVQEL